MFKWRTLLFGLVFGLIDALSLSLVKGISHGWSKLLMVIPIALYAINPVIFLQALSGESLTIMNLVWDLVSDVIVTAIGLFVFSETLPPIKLAGVCLSFLSLALMTYEG